MEDNLFTISFYIIFWFILTCSKVIVSICGQHQKYDDGNKDGNNYVKYLFHQLNIETPNENRITKKLTSVSVLPAGYFRSHNIKLNMNAKFARKEAPIMKPIRPAIDVGMTINSVPSLMIEIRLPTFASI